MRRRAFIAGLGGAAAWPLVGRGQQQAKLPIVGFLGSGTPESQNVWLTAFLKRLHELGWMEDRNLSIEYRWANGSSEGAGEFATEFVRHNVTVIVTYPEAPARPGYDARYPDASLVGRFAYAPRQFVGTNRHRSPLPVVSGSPAVQ
jgi:hypothetical protein